LCVLIFELLYQPIELTAAHHHAGKHDGALNVRESRIRSPGTQANQSFQLCDDLLAVRKTRLQRLVGALPGRVLVDVNKGIRSALDCEP
jgi:hypothetical protein